MKLWVCLGIRIVNAVVGVACGLRIAQVATEAIMLRMRGSERATYTLDEPLKSQVSHPGSECAAQIGNEALGASCLDPG